MASLASFVAGLGATACGTSGAAPVDAGAAAQDVAAGEDAPGRLDGSNDVDAGNADGSVEAAADAAVDAPGEAAALPRVVAYASGYAPDIQWLAVDAQSGALAPGSSVTAFGAAPSFLAIDGASRHLYAVDESTPGQVGAYSIDPDTGALSFLGAVPSGGDGPPFVMVDGPWVMVANYTSGTVSVLPVKSDGSLGAAVDIETVGSLAHMILPIRPTTSCSYRARVPTTWRSSPSMRRRAS